MLLLAISLWTGVAALDRFDAAWATPSAWFLAVITVVLIVAGSIQSIVGRD